MIAIVNVSPDADPAGWNDYELRINQEVIAKFKHHRIDGLAVCLERATAAAKEHEDGRLVRLLMGMQQATAKWTGE